MRRNDAGDNLCGADNQQGRFWSDMSIPIERLEEILKEEQMGNDSTLERDLARRFAGNRSSSVEEQVNHAYLRGRISILQQLIEEINSSNSNVPSETTRQQPE